METYGFDPKSFKTACLFTNRQISGLSTALHDAVEQLSELKSNIENTSITNADSFGTTWRGKSMKGLVMFIIVGSLLLGVACGIHFAFKPGATFSDFVGWPTEKHLHTVMVGLLLGFVFGFLDNFGLFYGMDVLDPLFYKFASVTMLSHTKDSPERLHKLADGMMNGLGNTFSDLLGILIGTAVLQTANASFNVNAGNFWPMDFVAIILGCLVGAYLPALMKEGRDSDKKAAKLALGIMVALLGFCMYVPSDGEKLGREGHDHELHYIKWILFLLFIVVISVTIFGKRRFSKNETVMNAMGANMEKMIDGDMIQRLALLQNDLAEMVDGDFVDVPPGRPRRNAVSGESASLLGD